MTRATLGFGDRDAPVPCHICLFYRDDDELRERLRFLTVGLHDPKQACVLFGKFERLSSIVGYLAEESEHDIEAALESGRLVLIDGMSTGDATLAHIGATLDGLVARGVSLIRFLGFIAWGDSQWPPQDDLLAFEAKVNAVVLSYPAIVVCSYKIDSLSGPILIKGGIQTHPLTLIGTTFCENPHYVPPAEFLEQLQRTDRADHHPAAAAHSIDPERLEQLVRSAFEQTPQER